MKEAPRSRNKMTTIFAYNNFSSSVRMFDANVNHGRRTFLFLHLLPLLFLIRNATFIPKVAYALLSYKYE